MLRFTVRRLLLLVPILIGISLLDLRLDPGAAREPRPRRCSASGRRRRTSTGSASSTGSTSRSTSSTGATSQTVGHGELGTASRPAGRSPTRSRSAFPATVELASGGRLLRGARRDPARLPRGEEVRNLIRPRKPGGKPDRRLDPDLLPRADPQVHLRRAARVAAERRPTGRPDRARAPDELLRPRRDHHRELAARSGTRSGT